MGVESFILNQILKHPTRSIALASGIGAAPLLINKLRQLGEEDYTGPFVNGFAPSTSASIIPLVTGAITGSAMSKNFVEGAIKNNRLAAFAKGSIPGLLAGAAVALPASLYLKSKENSYMEKPWIARKLIEKYIGSLPILGNIS